MLNYGVSFNSKHAVFYPNTQVTATVYLETDKILKARKIDIRVIGVAKTLWHEYHHYGGNNGEYIPYGAEIYYINAYSILWRSRDGTNKLQPGKYQFPLKFVIPANAPPCMSGEYGGISYYVRTNIDIPWARDEERIYGFSVCPYVDLNLDRRLAQTVYTVGTEMQSKCCSEYPLNVRVSIPKTGYTPGEIIQLKITVTNKTTWTIKKFEIGIVENLAYTGHCQSIWGHNSWYGAWGYGPPPTLNRSSSRVVTAKKIIVNSNINESTTFTITVPPLAPNYQACPIITNNYSLYVKTFTNAVFSSGPEVLFPITIGSVPIRDPSAPTPSQPPVAPLPTTPTENEKSSKKIIGSNKSSTSEKDEKEVAVSP